MPKQLEKIVETAAAYRSPGPEVLAGFLERIGDLIVAAGDKLISTCAEETALSVDRLVGERTRTVNQLKMFAERVREGSWVDARIDTPLPDRKPVPKPDLRRMLMPLGPVAVFGASNFPLAFSVAGRRHRLGVGGGMPGRGETSPWTSRNFRNRSSCRLASRRRLPDAGRRVCHD